MTPKCKSPAQTSPLNPRLTCPLHTLISTWMSNEHLRLSIPSLTSGLPTPSHWLHRLRTHSSVNSILPAAQTKKNPALTSLLSFSHIPGPICQQILLARSSKRIRIHFSVTSDLVQATIISCLEFCKSLMTFSLALGITTVALLCPHCPSPHTPPPFLNTGARVMLLKPNLDHNPPLHRPSNGSHLTQKKV